MVEEGSSGIMGKIVKMILIVLVIFVVFFAAGELGAAEKIRDLFPDFVKTENKVDWNEEYFINNPEILVFQVKAPEANIFFRYDNDPIKLGGREGEDIGWKWSKDNENWFSVESSGSSYGGSNTGNFFNALFRRSGGSNKYLSKMNKEFVESLIGKSPEEGLEEIVNRVLRNKEGNWFWFDAKLFVYYDGEKIPKQQDYDEDSPELKDLDGFIDKINQISYGVVKNNE
jgi:hypothetical protein